MEYYIFFPILMVDIYNVHGLFGVFAGHSKQSRRTFYRFAGKPCKSTAKSSEPCSTAFKGVQTDLDYVVSPAVDFIEFTSFIYVLLVTGLCQRKRSFNCIFWTTLQTESE